MPSVNNQFGRHRFGGSRWGLGTTGALQGPPPLPPGGENRGNINADQIRASDLTGGVVSPLAQLLTFVGPAIEGDVVLIDALGNGYSGSAFGGRSGSQVDVVPAGDMDGANQDFSLPSVPNPPGSLKVFLNGVLQRPVDIVLSGSTITYEVPPRSYDSHVASYLR